MAKRFRFRLEAVQKVRTQRRDGLRRELADALRSAAAVEQRIARISDAIRANVEQARSDQQVSLLDVVSLRGHQLQRNHLHRRLLESHVVLSERKREVEARRARLAEASKDLKAIEKLRDKLWARHCEQVRREEQAASDEVAVQRFLHDRSAIGREDRT